MSKPALLALADGSVFHGVSIGAEGVSVGEVVFNTAMAGYQEILTDPSSQGQLLAFTYPHIGNTGANDADNESAGMQAAGLILREVPRPPSSWRAQQSLPEFLAAQGAVAIAGVDTRRLTRLLRDKGTQGGCIVAGEADASRELEQARACPGLQGMELAGQAGAGQRYQWTDGLWGAAKPAGAAAFHVLVYDFGVRRTTLGMLVARGCRVTVLPGQTGAAEALALAPDGVVFSNGPGDPASCAYATGTAQSLMEAKVPLFGTGLGHQILGLAGGGRTAKMKTGHHGANHPVLELDTGKVLITGQNHVFAVEEDSLGANARATHRSLFDGSLQGFERTDCPVLTFQGYPEFSPGPYDTQPLYDRFIQLMRESRPNEIEA